jgi:hypothetical protein
MITKRTVQLLLFVFVSYAAASCAQDNDPVPSACSLAIFEMLLWGHSISKKIRICLPYPKTTLLLIAA